MTTLRKIFIQVIYYHLIGYLNCNLSFSTVFKCTIDNFNKIGSFANEIDNSPFKPIIVFRYHSENMQWTENQKLKYSYKQNQEKSKNEDLVYNFEDFLILLKEPISEQDQPTLKLKFFEIYYPFKLKIMLQDSHGKEYYFPFIKCSNSKKNNVYYLELDLNTIRNYIDTESIKTIAIHFLSESNKEGTYCILKSIKIKNYNNKLKKVDQSSSHRVPVSDPSINNKLKEEVEKDSPDHPEAYKKYPKRMNLHPKYGWIYNNINTERHPDDIDYCYSYNPFITKDPNSRAEWPIVIFKFSRVYKPFKLQIILEDIKKHRYYSLYYSIPEGSDHICSINPRTTDPYSNGQHADNCIIDFNQIKFLAMRYLPPKNSTGIIFVLRSMNIEGKVDPLTTQNIKILSTNDLMENGSDLDKQSSSLSEMSLNEETGSKKLSLNEIIESIYNNSRYVLSSPKLHISHPQNKQILETIAQVRTIVHPYKSMHTILQNILTGEIVRVTSPHKKMFNHKTDLTDEIIYNNSTPHKLKGNKFTGEQVFKQIKINNNSNENIVEDKVVKEKYNYSLCDEEKYKEELKYSFYRPIKLILREIYINYNPTSIKSVINHIANGNFNINNIIGGQMIDLQVIPTDNISTNISTQENDLYEFDNNFNQKVMIITFEIEFRVYHNRSLNDISNNYTRSKSLNKVVGGQIMEVRASLKDELNHRFYIHYINKPTRQILEIECDRLIAHQ